MASLDNVKILLDITDTSQDALLNLYLSRATNFVKNYCNVDEVTPSLDEIIEDIAVYMYRNRGVENVKSESKGSLSETYHEDFPPSYIRKLNEHRRVKFV